MYLSAGAPQYIWVTVWSINIDTFSLTANFRAIGKPYQAWCFSITSAAQLFFDFLLLR